MARDILWPTFLLGMSLCVEDLLDRVRMATPNCTFPWVSGGPVPGLLVPATNRKIVWGTRSVWRGRVGSRRVSRIHGTCCQQRRCLFRTDFVFSTLRSDSVRMRIFFLIEKRF